MPVYPAEWTTAQKTGNYPNMAKHDRRLWERFLDVFGGQFEEVAYNVALGGSILNDPTADPSTLLGWRYNTALKIDAVARNAAEAWVIEVRPGAGSAALGAALTYTILADRDGFAGRPLVPCVVTDSFHPDVKIAAADLDVLVIELPEPEDAESPRPPSSFTDTPHA